MVKDIQIKRCFRYMIYGDILGFLKENVPKATIDLKPFNYVRDQDLKMQIPQGQWSDLSEFILMMTKCLIDEKEKSRVTIDYNRLKDELKLWQYYRHGGASNFLQQLEAGEDYYQKSQFYHDKRGYGFSRILPILLANKNFEAAKEEVLKQTLFLNYHPQVILTNLLLSRTIFILLEKGNQTKEGLLDQLKEYLISLQRHQLLKDSKKQVTKKYIVEFEQEKINFLMTLDRLKDSRFTIEKDMILDSKTVFALTLETLWRLQEGILPDYDVMPSNDLKETLALAYGLWGINTGSQQITSFEVKNEGFIDSMGEYICKIRNYEVSKKPYIPLENDVDLFQLKLGSVIKHPILNVTKILSKEVANHYIKVEIETKTGFYRLYKKYMKEKTV